jgi:hypothetical protein
VYGKAELWRAYREAFQKFAQRVDELESLETNQTTNRTSVDRALFELERARVHYRDSRDALALALLAGRRVRFALDQSSTPQLDDYQRVREVAQLL